MSHNVILEIANTKNLGALSYKARFRMSGKTRKPAITSTGLEGATPFQFLPKARAGLRSLGCKAKRQWSPCCFCRLERLLSLYPQAEPDHPCLLSTPLPDTSCLARPRRPRTPYLPHPWGGARLLPALPHRALVPGLLSILHHQASDGSSVIRELLVARHAVDVDDVDDGVLRAHPHLAVLCHHHAVLKGATTGGCGETRRPGSPSAQLPPAPSLQIQALIPLRVW